jgi:hypothetical protein
VLYSRRSLVAAKYESYFFCSFLQIGKQVKIGMQTSRKIMSHTSSSSVEIDEESMARIVQKILNKYTEQALLDLSNLYKVCPPEIIVGTIKGKRKTVYAVYVPNENRIYAMNSDIFYNPFVILHEFYHHLRSRGGVHRGSEKNANLYAKKFIEAYSKLVTNK